ncbi:hypothetical protein ABPG72_001526 [Tetrahymena utriculariae]
MCTKTQFIITTLNKIEDNKYQQDRKSNTIYKPTPNKYYYKFNKIKKKSQKNQQDTINHFHKKYQKFPDSLIQLTNSTLNMPTPYYLSKYSQKKFCKINQLIDKSINQ